MNILLTGGSGFIGKNIIEQLSHKYNILAPRHKELDLVDEDAVGAYFLNHNIDIVIHSAVKPGHRNSSDTSHLLYNNTRMFFNLARNSQRFGRMIFLSSGAAYNISRNMQKVTEEEFDHFVPKDEHGFSKYISAKYIEQTDNITELRLFGVFGKYEDYSIRFISNAICKAIYDIPISLRQNRKFDYVYIDDFVAILDRFIVAKPRQKVYNITPDRSLELLEIARKVLEITEKTLPIYVAMPGMGNEYSGANGRLVGELEGQGPLFTLMDDSIRQLADWTSRHIEEFKRDMLLYDK